MTDCFLLHIETSTKVCSVSVSNNGIKLATVETLDDGYVHGEKLTVFIQECINQANIELKNLSAISVSSGPGSYTGLRIGVSTAKGLCFGLEIPLISIDSLSALNCIAKKYLVNNEYKDFSRCPAIDARRMEIYNSIFDKVDNLLIPIQATIVEVNTFDEFEPFVYFGDGADKLKEIWQSPNKIFIDINASAEGQMELSYQKFKDGSFEDLAYFEPIYLKSFSDKS